MRHGWTIGNGLLALAAFPAIATTTPTTDFIDNGDGTVVHKTTGLAWKRCVEGQTWKRTPQKIPSGCNINEQGYVVCSSPNGTSITYTDNTGSTCLNGAGDTRWVTYSYLAARSMGGNGWRLPTVAELESLFNRDANFYSTSPILNPQIFPDTAYSTYLTSELNSRYGYPYAVNFARNDATGLAYGADFHPPSSVFSVRLVRTGPVPVFALPAIGKYLPQTLLLDGSASFDKFGQITDYAWSSSDGQQASGAQAQMTFAQPGSYTVTLTVTDDKGVKSSQSRPLTLEEPRSYQLPAGMTALRSGRGLEIANPLPYTGLMVYWNSKGEKFADLVKASRDAWFSGIYSDAGAWWQHFVELRGALRLLSAGGFDDQTRLITAAPTAIPLANDAKQATLTIAGEKSAFFDALQVMFDYAGLYDATLPDEQARRIRSRVILDLLSDPNDAYGVALLQETLRQGKLRAAFTAFGETALRRVLAVAQNEGVAGPVGVHLQQRLEGVGEGVRLDYLDAVLTLIEQESAIAYATNGYYRTPREMTAQLPLD